MLHFKTGLVLSTLKLRMIIFFRKIPSDTRPSDLKEHVEPVLKKFFLFTSGRILKTEILVLLDKVTEAEEYHGLVHISPESAGTRALKKLKGKPFKNRYLIIREYVVRDKNNDPRNKQVNIGRDIKDKRIEDRRRGNNLEILTGFPKIISAWNISKATLS